MNNLKHITFTGIDWKTDIHELVKIQNEYPYVEWGVLVSKNWKENGNRYFNPSFLSSIDGYGLNLSAHLCGSVARTAIQGNYDQFIDWAGEYYDIFKRCQLNVSNQQSNPEKFEYSDAAQTYFQEVIIQQKGVNECNLFLNSKDSEHVSVLLDASGGQGINTDIEILNLPNKAGYAGGINPDNVADKLTYLLDNCTSPFWIDMESGVRTNDWFDVEKVKQVLRICDNIIKKH